LKETQLIQDLIDRGNKLPHRNDAELDALQRRADMIIRKVFGDTSKYLDDLNDISFYTFALLSTSEQAQNERWNSGKSEMLNLFSTMLEELKLFGTAKTPKRVEKTHIRQSNQIFIVHGHNEAMKQAVARTLEKLGLEPIILHEKPDKGRTIIEKFTDYSNVLFAVVLLSPDDLGYVKGASLESAKFRARQNVIFELGFFVGKLGRERVCVLYQEVANFEMPTDYSGVLYTPFDRKGRWQFDLVKELKACDYDVDANKLLFL